MSIDVMKQALEALEECTAYTSSESWSPSMTRECEAAITALRSRLAQPEQEPVAWRITDGEGDYEYCTDLPEDWSIQWSARYGRKYEPLYTAPPQRKPLTDEEIERACVPLGAAMLSFTAVARAIEAAHGIGEQHE